MDYMTLKQTSEKWGISPRMINYYCSAGRIVGAVKMGTVWLIPKGAKKPQMDAEKIIKCCAVTFHGHLTVILNLNAKE